MKTKLQIIHTDDYILAVSEKEIKHGERLIHNEWYINSYRGYDKPFKNHNLDSNGYLKRFFAYQPKGNAPELDLPLLPEIVVEDDVRKLALTLYKEPLNKEGEVRTQLVGHGSTPFGFNKWFKAFKKGYKAATKIYDEEDLRKAIKFVTDNYTIDSWQNYDNKSSVNMSSNAIADKFIQSLKQPKTPTHFLLERIENNKCIGKYLFE